MLSSLLCELSSPQRALLDEGLWAACRRPQEWAGAPERETRVRVEPGGPSTRGRPALPAAAEAGDQVPELREFMPPELGRGVPEALGTASPTCPAKEGRAGVGGQGKRLEGMGQVCAVQGIWGFGPVTCRSRNLNCGRRCGRQDDGSLKREAQRGHSPWSSG